MFHTHNDYVKRQVQRFGLTQPSDGLTTFRDDLERTARLFSPSFHTHWRGEIMVSYILIGMFAARVLVEFTSAIQVKSEISSPN